VSETPRLRVERRVAASPASVYAFLTESERWGRWQGAGADVDAVAGGHFRMTMANGMVAEGRFLELVPEERVVFTWGWLGNAAVPPGSSTVEIELVPDGEGTLVRLTHRGLPADEIEIHDVGWRHYLPRLALVAEGGDPGADPGPALP
jgi:uncharacterized protein YndB with AHSA1/START domain